MSAPLVVTCGVIWRGARFLLARRADTGLWELPGGKLRPEESLEDCLRRELAEELEARVEALSYYGVVREERPRALELHAFVCRHTVGEPQARVHRELRWIELPQMAGFELCPADRQLAAAFAQRPPLPGPLAAAQLDKAALGW